MHHNSCYWAEQGAAINSHQQGFCSQYLSKSTDEVNKCTFQCAVESVKITSFPCWCFLSRTFHILKLRGKSEAAMLSLSHTLTPSQTDTLFLTLKNIHTHILYSDMRLKGGHLLLHIHNHTVCGDIQAYVFTAKHTHLHMWERLTQMKSFLSPQKTSVKEELGLSPHLGIKVASWIFKGDLSGISTKSLFQVKQDDSVSLSNYTKMVTCSARKLAVTVFHSNKRKVTFAKQARTS